MIHVITTVVIEPGARDSFLGAFRRMAVEARKQPGCMEYGAAVDADTGISAQSGHEPDHITVIEKWDSVEALKANAMAPHMLAFKLRSKDLVRTQKLKVLSPV